MSNVTVPPLAALIRDLDGGGKQVVHRETLAARPARHRAPAVPLAPTLVEILAERGIQSLYAHQAAALDAARAGHNLGVVTATASGKTLCYQLPTLEAILDQPESRALFLFPTKALAHDQLRALHTLTAALPDVHAATIDGDTPKAQRSALQRDVHILLSNPDMLHRSILPQHTRWAAFLRNLRYLVLDEAHVYRGVFGSHVAFVVRRLRRLCTHYGADPQIICCSATSANPQEHLEALVGAPVRVISGDGAPQGERTFVFWNPPLIDNPRQREADADRGQRRSTNVESANLWARLVAQNIKTLTFARSRRGAELMLLYAREHLEQHNPEKIRRIAAYRAGYRPEERRRLEQQFLVDELQGIVSTNALELGVDIGGLDAVVLSGYPGTIASTWQQVGRAGRSQGQSLALLVAADDPIDQFYMRHPAQFFDRSSEHARVALDNPYILADQMVCAAFEHPLAEDDAQWFGATFARMRDWLLRQGRLLERGKGIVPASHWPSAEVNIRSADGGSVGLYDNGSGRLIEQINASRAPFEVYPGAVYLSQGDAYVVERLDMPGQRAEARPAAVSYYTQTRSTTDMHIRQVRQQTEVSGTTLCFGMVQVAQQVTSFVRKRHFSEEVLEEVDLEVPPQQFVTQAVWFTVPAALCDKVARHCGDLPGALHALEHAMIGVLPLYAQCDRRDIGGVSTALHPETNAATIFVYDGVPGGVGIAEVGYHQIAQWWQATRLLLTDCPCQEGCPACIHSPKCGNGNQPLSKAGALALVSKLSPRS